MYFGGDGYLMTDSHTANLMERLGAGERQQQQWICRGPRLLAGQHFSQSSVVRRAPQIRCVDIAASISKQGASILIFVRRATQIPASMQQQSRDTRTNIPEHARCKIHVARSETVKSILWPWDNYIDKYLYFISGLCNGLKRRQSMPPTTRLTMQDAIFSTICAL